MPGIIRIKEFAGSGHLSEIFDSDFFSVYLPGPGSSLIGGFFFFQIPKTSSDSFDFDFSKCPNPMVITKIKYPSHTSPNPKSTQ